MGEMNGYDKNVANAQVNHLLSWYLTDGRSDVELENNQLYIEYGKKWTLF